MQGGGRQIGERRRIGVAGNLAARLSLLDRLSENHPIAHAVGKNWRTSSSTAATVAAVPTV